MNPLLMRSCMIRECTALSAAHSRTIPAGTSALADPRGLWELWSLKRPTKFFCAKTDFRTNWPTPQFVIMQKGVQLQMATLIPDLLWLCPSTQPQTPLYIRAPRSLCGNQTLALDPPVDQWASDKQTWGQRRGHVLDIYSLRRQYMTAGWRDRWAMACAPLTATRCRSRVMSEL